MRLSASSKDCLPCDVEPDVLLEPGRSYSFELSLVALESGKAIGGVVLDARTGLPIADARVEADGFYWTGEVPRDRTTSTGRFRLTGLAAAPAGWDSGSRPLLRIESPGYARLRPEDVHFLGLRNGDAEFELRLEPMLCGLRGLVFERRCRAP